MKKALSTLLVFIAVLQIGGITPFYFYFLQLVKDEIKVELAGKSDLDRVLISEREFNNPAVFQLTDQHEFRYKGEMYDFQSMQKVDDNYVFFALADNKEYTLEKILSNDFQQSSDKNAAGKNTGGKVLKDFCKDFTFCNNHVLHIVSPQIRLLSRLPFAAPLSDGHTFIMQYPPNHA